MHGTDVIGIEVLESVLRDCFTRRQTGTHPARIRPVAANTNPDTKTEEKHDGRYEIPA
ncbi:hypothetical protein [Thiocapsa sp.]|uniref:hypothetical protein n=1 Tax=Thiocapsa sp. TaxID=2024551 RepID=UPI00359329E4